LWDGLVSITGVYPTTNQNSTQIIGQKQCDWLDHIGKF
jgi:hypothetical protein